MSAEINRSASIERALGAELVRAAEMVLAGVHPDPGDASIARQVKTVDVLLALYWKLRCEPPAAITAGGAVGSLQDSTRRRQCRWPRACDPGS